MVTLLKSCEWSSRGRDRTPADVEGQESVQAGQEGGLPAARPGPQELVEVHELDAGARAG